MNVHFVFGTENEASQTNSEGWFGFGMATVGIDPNTFEVLIGHPTKIPTDRILGDVVQNCPRFLDEDKLPKLASLRK